MIPTRNAPKGHWLLGAGLSFGLVLLVLAVFGQTAGFSFVNYDDDQYVYNNPVVAKGLTPGSVGWAFTHPQVGNWIPLTTLSHILDCQLFGLDPRGHHLVNVLWHGANTVLLFWVLWEMTGGAWRSAFMAAVFAVHPLRAESVAWVSERKDVLSGFFFILALGVYVRQVRRPSRIKYVGLILVFTLGLLAKSMVATLPLVLLLLDYWPLGRMRDGRQFWQLAREKIPLFGLAVAACAATALVPGLVVTGAQRLPLMERVGNAVVSYAVYLRQLFFPAGLATPYPYPAGGHPAWEVAAAFVLLAAISAWAFASRNKAPAILVGWLWFVGMLLPVIGLVQISNDAAHADRYTYLPEIGLTLGITWAAAEWTSRWKHQRGILGSAMAVMVGALVVTGHQQASYWKDDKTLWTHSLACAFGNSSAHNNLGLAYAKEGAVEKSIAEFDQAIELNPSEGELYYNRGISYVMKGDLDQAITQFRRGLELKPAAVEIHNNLGVALLTKGFPQEALQQFQESLRIEPNNADAHYDLGGLLLNYHKLDEAIAQFREAVALDPEKAEAFDNLGNALAMKGDDDNAIVQYEKALAIEPNNAGTRSNLANALARTGRRKEAIAHYRRVLELKPGQVEAQGDLAWWLATSPEAALRDGKAAVALATQANQSSGGGNAMVLRILAAAYAEDGNYQMAAPTAQKALDLANAQGNAALVRVVQKEIRLYESGNPARSPSIR
jgi:tetratricopeptide (TPR) repeat protein